MHENRFLRQGWFGHSGYSSARQGLTGMPSHLAMRRTVEKAATILKKTIRKSFSGLAIGRRLHFATEPGSCKDPHPSGSPNRHADHVGGFIDCEADEKAQ